MEYTLNELMAKRNAILFLLEKGKKDKITSKLTYALRKNLSKIGDELEIVRKDLKDNAEGFDEYQQRRFEVAVECGGEVVQTPQGGREIKDLNTIDGDKFEKKIEELNGEYEEVIEAQKEVEKFNNEKAKEKVAEINWFPIKLDYFNDSINSDDMPQELIDMIEVA